MSERTEGQGSEPGQGSPRKPDANAVLKAAESLASNFAAHLFGRIAAALDDSVRASTEKPSDDPNGSPLQEDLQLLILHKEQISKAFRTALAHHYEQSLDASSSNSRHYLASGESSQTSFSLVDDSQLEEWLMIDNMVARIQDRFGDELALLEERFRYLLPSSNVNRSRLPLGPEKFCRAFHDALESVHVDVKTRTHCYSLLDSILAEEAGNLYSAVNQFMAKKGVLPTLKAPSKKEPARARPDDRTAPRDPPQGHPEGANAMTGGAGAGAKGGSLPLHDQTFEAVQTLLRAHFAKPVEADGSTREEAGVSELPVTPMLVDTLSALQRDASAIERSGELIRGGLRHFVHGRYSAEDGQGGRINQIDDETIEVISMIFDYILDDGALPDFMKALIGRLQIPVLKVAIVDRSFFSRKDHPARQLLNELAQAGASWRDENEAAKDRLYEKLEAIVRRILKEFENDVTIFDTLLADLRAFLEEETRRFSEAQEQLLAAAHEAERIEHVKAQVVQEIASRLIGHEIPEDMRDFLVVPWRQFITTITLAEGEHGEERQQALKLIEDLLWSLTPKRSAEERRRLTQMLPSLLGTIRKGLAYINYGEREAEDFISSLERHHFVSLKAGTRAERQATRTGSEQSAGSAQPTTSKPPEGERIDSALEQFQSELDELPSVDWARLSSFDDVVDPNRFQGNGSFEKMLAEMEATPERDEGPRVEDDFTQLVRELKIGTWVELPSDDGGDVRAKLAWKGDEHGHYAFVNRQFKVVAERPLYELADQFRQGTATVIDNIAVFDRAVDGVIAGIMKLTRGGSH